MLPEERIRAALHLNGKAREELLAEAANANERFEARFKDLWKARAPATVSMAALADARQAAGLLREERNPSLILTTYEKADAALSILEGYIERAVWAYDEYINNEIDRRRGK